MNLKDKLQELPKEPGCYLMKNINSEVIYVGKAKNLSNRVKSYFVGAHNAKTTRLVMDIVDFDFYGEDDFNDDELDGEGFENIDFNDSNY